MAKVDTKAVALFKEKAKNSAISVVEVKNTEEAIKYALEVCEKKDACQLLLAGCEQNLSAEGAAACERPFGKVIVAPALTDEDFALLSKEGKKKKFTVLKGGMRDNLAGVDIGLTYGDMAIAETATTILACANEELRLATMVCEIHVAIIPKSRVVKTSYDAEDYLNSLMKQDGPMYTAFITGPSRTADIERVLAIGVHGPLEMHVALVEG